jgi:hypothetical protein
MAKVIITAMVDNAEEWEKGFRTHGDLFRKQKVASPISFSVSGANEVAILMDTADLDLFMKVLDSPETGEAMTMDGVKKETVKVFELDKEMEL